MEKKHLRGRAQMIGSRNEVVMSMAERRRELKEYLSFGGRPLTATMISF